MKYSSILTLVTFLVVSAGSAFAQTETGDIQAKASIAADLSVFGLQDLDFEDVIRDTPKTVEQDDANNAGIFQISGPDDDVLLTFTTLPTVLEGPAGNTMPISYVVGWANTQTGVAVDTETPVQGTQFASYKNFDGGASVFYVRLGGTVSPSDTQAAGNYSATVVLTAELN